MRSASAGLALLVTLALALVTAADAQAQMASGQGHVQVGLGVIPGVGLQAVYVQPRALYTIEGAVYADFSPSFAGGEGSIQLSGAVGGALRAFGIVRALGNPAYSNSDLDVGLRLGPSLFFALGESSRSENPFSLFLEPYGRFATELAPNRTGFIELGLQRPILRAGVMIVL